MTDPHDTIIDREVVLEVMKDTIGRKIDSMIREGFDGWAGTVTVGEYTLLVDLSIKNHPDWKK